MLLNLFSLNFTILPPLYIKIKNKEKGQKGGRGKRLHAKAKVKELDNLDKGDITIFYS